MVPFPVPSQLPFFQDRHFLTGTHKFVFPFFKKEKERAEHVQIVLCSLASALSAVFLLVSLGVGYQMMEIQKEQDFL